MSLHAPLHLDGTAVALRLAPLGELDEAMCARAYAEVLAPAMAADELMTLEEVRAAHVDGREPSAVLLGPDGPVAVALGSWYADRQVLLLTYLAVRSDQRGAGLGTRLVREVLRGWSAAVPGAVVVAEVDDPRVRPGDTAVGDAVARLRFYDRLGARLLPAPWTQPALRPGAPRVDGMLLLRLDGTGPSAPDALRRFAIDYFAAHEGDAARSDPTVLALASRTGDLADPSTSWPVGRAADVPSVSCPSQEPPADGTTT